jgi:hypothetical protein
MPAAFRFTLSQPDVGALVAFIRSLANGPTEPPVPLPPLAVHLTDAGTP